MNKTVPFKIIPASCILQQLLTLYNIYFLSVSEIFPH